MLLLLLLLQLLVFLVLLVDQFLLLLLIFGVGARIARIGRSLHLVWLQIACVHWIGARRRWRPLRPVSPCGRCTGAAGRRMVWSTLRLCRFSTFSAEFS